MKPADILHRAKRIDNGEWVEGYYMNDASTNNHIIARYRSSTNFVALTEIDPSTLCVWTTLLDKNGKKVFSGDIVSLQGSRVAIGIVEYVESECAFMLMMNKGYAGYSKTPLHSWNSQEYTIIGSIHN